MIASSRKIKILRFLLSFLKKILFLGARIIFRINKNDPFEVFISEAFYAPWKEDIEFQKYYRKYANLTMLDQVRLYTFWEAIENIESIDGDVIEVGSWKGGVSFLMAEKIRSMKQNKTVFAYDTFHGVVKSGIHDPYYKDNEHDEASLDEFNANIEKFKTINIEVFSGIYPDSFTNNISDNIKYSLAHIDVDTFQSAYDSFKYIWHRLSKNGIVIFDDYGFHQTNGIRICISQIRKEFNCSFFYLQCGQAVIIKK
tara:strand:- start:17 stop:781 length:765 start_codon:yes stop_codon:yes gene_type:complete